MLSVNVIQNQNATVYAIVIASVCLWSSGGSSQRLLSLPLLRRGLPVLCAPDILIQAHAPTEFLLSPYTILLPHKKVVGKNQILGTYSSLYAF